jgi:hypothetical protein
LIDVDTASFFAIVMVAAVAAITVALVPKRLALALRRHEEADRQLHLDQGPDGSSPPLGGEPVVQPAA